MSAPVPARGVHPGTWHPAQALALLRLPPGRAAPQLCHACVRASSLPAVQVRGRGLQRLAPWEWRPRWMRSST
jgi:hypothetical protein